MTTKHLLEPELLPLVDLLPAANFSVETLPAIRQQMASTVQLGDPEERGVSRSEVYAKHNDGEPVRCLLYQPNAPEQSATEPRPAYLHVHGGGYIVGSPESSDVVNLRLCAKLQITVLAVAYRLAPEHPIPAPLDDCYTALGWLHQNAQALNVDPQRIGIGGESAGGGLAAALALQAQQLGEHAICHQHLTYPMLDDRTGTPANPGDPLVGEFVWTRESNQFGWQSYLGNAPAEAPQVPARATDLAGLPRTWLLTAGMDLFRDEDIEYAQRLMLAGVETELLVYPAAPHGFQMLPGTAIGARYARDHLDGLRKGLRITD